MSFEVFASTLLYKQKDCVYANYGLNHNRCLDLGAQGHVAAAAAATVNSQLFTRRPHGLVQQSPTHLLIPNAYKPHLLLLSVPPTLLPPSLFHKLGPLKAPLMDSLMVKSVRNTCPGG